MTQPIRYSRHRHNHRRVYVTLGLTWVISVSVSLPIAVGMNYTERRRETPWLCTFYNSDFLIYSSMLSFYIPCLLMIFLYFKTFRAIRQVALKKKQRLQKQKRLCKRKMHKNAEKVALASRLSEGTTDSDLDGASDCGSQKNLMPTRIRKKFAQLRASGGGGTLRKKASESEISSTHSPLMDETELELINRGGMRRVPGNECTCLTTGKGDHVVYESTTPRILEVSEELNPTAGSELQSESKTAGDDGQHVPRTGEDGQLVPLSNFSVVVRLNGENDTASSCRSELRKNRRFSRVVSLSPPPRLSERGSRRGFTTRERKATKTLAIVLGEMQQITLWVRDFIFLFFYFEKYCKFTETNGGSSQKFMKVLIKFVVKDRWCLRNFSSFVFRGSLRRITVHDISRQFMAVLDSSWRFSTVHGSSPQFMVVLDRYIFLDSSCEK